MIKGNGQGIITDRTINSGGIPFRIEPQIDECAGDIPLFEL